jgi:predicted DsbA family dithiol-disulfide isomerase
MPSNTNALKIDIISDVVCPWCIIGYRQLEQALKATGTTYEINWHPFELNPDMPAKGQNLRQHVAEKYGVTQEQSEQNRNSMVVAGASVGFEFRFTDDMRMHNTFNLHQLLHWANQQGAMHNLKQALFSAHFTYSRDISDHNTLADVAAEIGLERSEALAVLQSQCFSTAVRDAENSWLDKGISAVPAIIFNDRHLVTGAQGVENYTRILQQLVSGSEIIRGSHE